MYRTVEHIKHSRTNSDICSFYICNIFNIDIAKIELHNVFEYDLLNEKYFQSGKELKKTVESQNAFFKDVKNKTNVINSYGPLLKPTLSTIDFEIMDYKTYNSKMKFIIAKMKKSGDEYESLDLEKFHQQSLIDLQSFNLENREYYFLNADSIDNSKKHEFEYWYSYFLTVIGIDPKLNSVLILNFGNE